MYLFRVKNKALKFPAEFPSSQDVNQKLLPVSKLPEWGQNTDSTLVHCAA